MGKRSCEIGDFKGYPIIKVFTGKEYKGEPECVTLGVKKAAAVCEHIDEIRAFVDKNS